MSSEFMRKTADVLEKLAERLDSEEVARQKVAQDERLKLATRLGEKYTAATGEDLSPEVLEKIASSNADVLDTFTRLVDRGPRSENPDDMGDAHDPREDNLAYGTSKTAMTKEAADQADDRFLDWVMS